MGADRNWLHFSDLPRLEEEPTDGGAVALSDERIDFADFARVLARFRPYKKSSTRNKLNSREDKLKCKMRPSTTVKTEPVLSDGLDKLPPRKVLFTPIITAVNRAEV